MSSSVLKKPLILAMAAGLACSAALPADESPHLGQPLDEAAAAALDFTVLPNGDGLPAGAGTALEGEAVYRQHCIACHGEGGNGAVNEALVGGQGTLATQQPEKTVGSYWPYATTIFDYVRKAMPLPAPGTLSDDEIYALTAYILYLNDIIDEREAMTAKTLPGVKMPNRNGFVWAYSP